jgi:hypothetical protein
MPTNRDDVGGVTLLLRDMRMRSLLVGEARRRVVTGMFGVPGGDQSVLVTVILLAAAATGVRGIVARPWPRPSGVDAAIGVSVGNTALRGIAGPAARNMPLAGALIAVAVVSHALRPAMAGSIHEVHVLERGLRRAFGARYGRRPAAAQGGMAGGATGRS